MGDSFTEGVGDVDRARPNGVRGWADRTAEQLARHDGDWGYANLAIRGRKMRGILREQVDATVAMRPTLVTIYSGVNDLMRPNVDIDGMARSYDEAIARLTGSGAQVLMFTGFDPRASKLFGALLRFRVALYNEQIRQIADTHGATLVDYWRFREYDDARMWCEDRIHMSTPGHQNMARRVLDVLGKPCDIPPVQLPDPTAAPWQQRARDHARWTREFAGPWVSRRLRGTSSGDGLSPRWPTLRPASGLAE